MKTYIKNTILFLAVVTFLSCEQERLDPVLTTADGGGTLNTYTAYTIDSTDPEGSNVYGRIVFYQTTTEQTLVQIALYNTVDGLMHPALIIDGAAGMGTTTMMALDTVDGSDGEFSSSKFFVITDSAFYDSVTSLDAHVSISLSAADDTIIATGNLGVNAEPVETN